MILASHSARRRRSLISWAVLVGAVGTFALASCDVTTIEVGEGRAAEVGDTLVIDYVGVLSADCSAVDSTYDSEPDAVTLGDDLIVGWERGLLGVQAGERRQLDVPSELTYVVDVGLVVEKSDASDKPTEQGVRLGVSIDQTTSKVLVEGSGDTFGVGDHAVVRMRDPQCRQQRSRPVP